MGRSDTDNRYDRSKGPILVGIIGNLALFIVKIALAFFIGSVALLADAFHSLSDTGTTGMVWAGMRVSSKKPDRDHPFGHARAEYITGLIIAVLLAVIGLEIVNNALMSLLFNDPIFEFAGTWWAVLVVVATIIIKEIMARYTHRVGHDMESEALEADAWHHRTDALSSLGVLIAVLGAMYGLVYLDVIMAVMIGVLIVIVGFRIGMGCSSTLLGRCPLPSEIDTIRNIVENREEVKDLHELDIHDYGHDHLAINMHLRMDDRMPLDRAHTIVSDIEHEIGERLGAKVTIHFEPESGKGEKDEDG